MIPAFVPILALCISALGLIGAGVGWLLVDAREKTRAAVLGEQVAQLMRNDRDNVAEIARLKTDLSHARDENKRLDQIKADRSLIEAVRETMGTIVNRLDKIDDKIDHIRDRNERTDRVERG